MKKIAALTLLTALTLTGCAASDMDGTTLPTANPTSESTNSPEATSPESTSPETISYVTGFGDEDYNNEDEAELLKLLQNSCDKGMSEGLVETFGAGKSVMFNKDEGYEGYSAFYEDAETKELIYSTDYFFTCFITMEYQMLSESGSATPEDFHIQVVKVNENTYQVKYAADPEYTSTSQYVFDADGNLSAVVSNPEEGEPLTVKVAYGKPGDVEFATLKELVVALQ